MIEIETRTPPTQFEHGLQHGTPGTLTLDVRALEADLRSAVRGEARFGDGDRALYAADASNYRQVPIGVVLPLDAEDSVAAVAVCRRHGAPILARGGGTAIPGQSVNVAVM